MKLTWDAVKRAFRPKEGDKRRRRRPSAAVDMAGMFVCTMQPLEWSVSETDWALSPADPLAPPHESLAPKPTSTGPDSTATLGAQSSEQTQDQQHPKAASPSSISMARRSLSCAARSHGKPDEASNACSHVHESGTTLDHRLSRKRPPPLSLSTASAVLDSADAPSVSRHAPASPVSPLFTRDATHSSTRKCSLQRRSSTASGRSVFSTFSSTSSAPSSFSLSPNFSTKLDRDGRRVLANRRNSVDGATVPDKVTRRRKSFGVGNGDSSDDDDGDYKSEECATLMVDAMRPHGIHAVDQRRPPAIQRHSSAPTLPSPVPSPPSSPRSPVVVTFQAVSPANSIKSTRRRSISVLPRRLPSLPASPTLSPIRQACVVDSFDHDVHDMSLSAREPSTRIMPLTMLTARRHSQALACQISRSNQYEWLLDESTMTMSVVSIGDDRAIRRQQRRNRIVLKVSCVPPRAVARS